VTKHLEGVLCGPEADSLAIAGDVELLDLGIFAVGEGDVDEAYGLGGVGAVGDGRRAGDSGDGEGESASGAAANAFGEGASDWIADCAMLFEEVGRDVGEGGLAAVGVGDGSTEEDTGAVGDCGEALAEPASGAALGDGEGVVADTEHEENDLFEGFAVEGEDVLSHLGGDEVEDGVDAGFGFGEAGLDAEEVELDLGASGKDGGFDVGELLVDGSGASVDLALWNEGHAEDAASEMVLGESCGEALLAGVVEERLELFGWSRKQDDELAKTFEGGVEPLAWGAAVGVGEEGGTGEDVGLAGVVGRHGHVAGGEAVVERLEESFVAVELEVESLGEALAGEVVFGGAEAAGEKDDVGAVEGDADRGGEVLAVVADDGLEGDGNAEVVETGGEVEGVGVLTVRGQHLGTNGDDLG